MKPLDSNSAQWCRLNVWDVTDYSSMELEIRRSHCQFTLIARCYLTVLTFDHVTLTLKLSTPKTCLDGDLIMIDLCGGPSLRYHIGTNRLQYPCRARKAKLVERSRERTERQKDQQKCVNYRIRKCKRNYVKTMGEQPAQKHTSKTRPEIC